MGKQPQTIEKETAQKLYTLGLRKTCYFWWHHQIKWTENSKKSKWTILSDICIQDGHLGFVGGDFYPAYQLHEILEMLPENYDLIFHKIGGTFWFQYRNSKRLIKTIDLINVNNNEQTPTEAAGNLLLWCIENDYVKVENLNNE
jgi:hypothetical protein